jgi:hypothetical protein
MDEGCDQIVTMTDRLGCDIQIAACSSKMNAEGFANLFFNTWFCENGCPLEIVSDCDKLFISAFWRSLTKLAGIKLKMSTAYHPQTDGTSERTNKTVIQCLRYHVGRNQKGWVKSLPRVRFDMMNMINASTGFSPFVLKSGKSPRLLPPLLPEHPEGGDTSPEAVDAQRIIESIEADLRSTKVCMLAAKVSQAHHSNKDRSVDPAFKVGDQVMLSTSQRQREYMQAKDGRVAKLMARYDGPYKILEAYPDTSTYKI